MRVIFVFRGLIGDRGTRWLLWGKVWKICFDFWFIIVNVVGVDFMSLVYLIFIRLGLVYVVVFE